MNTLLLLFFIVTEYISISDFDISKGVLSSTIGLNIYAIIARTKKYKSKYLKKKHDEIVLLAKPNLDCIKSSISRSF